jgi:hypothetical protein
MTKLYGFQGYLMMLFQVQRSCNIELYGMVRRRKAAVGSLKVLFQYLLGETEENYGMLGKLPPYQPVWWHVLNVVHTEI